MSAPEHPIAAVFACLVVTACARAEAETGPGQPATTAESAAVGAYDAVRQRGALLLDVRSRQEFEAERVDGAHNIPAEEIGARLEEIAQLAGGRGRPVVVYCSTGTRSAVAKAKLGRAGFTGVIDARALHDWPVRGELVRGGAR